MLGARDASATTRRRHIQAAARAEASLLVAQLRLWFRPVGKLVICRAAAAALPLSEEGRAHAEEAALSVARAARRGFFRPSCLVRALALQRILESRGIMGSVVRIGVKRNVDQLLAHAWVEHCGVILGDSAEMVANFTVLTEARLAKSFGESR
jgi:hypothetical protein